MKKPLVVLHGTEAAGDVAFAQAHTRARGSKSVQDCGHEILGVALWEGENHV